MEVMIAVPLDLPPQALGVGDLEALVTDWGRQVMRQAMAAAWAAQAALRPAGPCPACGEAASIGAGRKARRVETAFGPVALPRQRRRCAGCGRHYQPDDGVLGLELGTGRLSPALRDLAALCGASWPYQQAAGVLGRRRGTPLSAETVRAAVGTVGRAVASAQAAEAAAAVAPPASAPPPRPVPARLEVELDGAWVHSRDNPHGLEVKVGVVHAGSVAVGATRRALAERAYAATARGVAAFGPLVTVPIEARNGFATVVQTLLGDGAGWIWRLGGELLPAAVWVLDRWHLTGARRRALRAALPDMAARAPWSERVEARLEAGAVPGAVALLVEVATVAPHPALDEFAASLTTLAPAIPNDAERRAAGERIGSGGVEKGVDVVVNRRLKGRRGMRWWRERVEGVVALRVALLNDEWERLVPPALTPQPLPAS